MTATMNINDLSSHRQLHGAGMSTRTIRFSWSEILYGQAQIVALWRSLRAEGLNPVAHTFLGRIMSITIHP